MEVTTAAERRRGVQPWRRLFHAGNGLILAFLPPLLGVDRWGVVSILSLILVGLVAFDLVRLRTPRLNVLFFKLFPDLASPREATHVASSTWYLCGVVLVYALFPSRVVAPSILVLALADPMASTVGRLWGGQRLGKGTTLGSKTFLVIAFAVLSVYFGPVAAAMPALIVTAVEVLPWRLDDNLTVPVAAAAALWLLGV